MLNENKWSQYGFIRDETDIDGIVIHEINDYEESASELFSKMNGTYKQNEGYHYLVDSHGVIELLPTYYASYNIDASNKFYNKNTISIALVNSLSEINFNQTVDHTVNLIQKIQNRYNIGKDHIYFHRNFDSKVFCPYKLLQEFGSARNFVYQKL